MELSKMWLTMIEPINGSEDNVKNFHGGSQKPPPPPPPSVAVAHKLDGISGAQSASDLSLLFNGGKKLFRYFQYFSSRFTLCVYLSIQILKLWHIKYFCQLTSSLATLEVVKVQNYSWIDAFYGHRVCWRRFHACGRHRTC